MVAVVVKSGHELQKELEVAPVVGLYVPMSQSVGVVEAGEAVYVPEGAKLQATDPEVGA